MLPSLHALATLGAAWRCLLPDARARAELLARDGLDTLAQLLDSGNRHLRCAALRGRPHSPPSHTAWRAPSHARPARVSAARIGLNGESASKRSRLQRRRRRTILRWEAAFDARCMPRSASAAVQPQNGVFRPAAAPLAPIVPPPHAGPCCCR
jgi:hypothetical protein